MEIFSVSELLEYLKALMALDERLSDMWLRGEVSNSNTYQNGHTYFRLKDASGVVDCVLFKGNALRQKYKPVNGTNYLMHGKVSIYEQTGKLQFYVDLIQPEGQGKLALEFELLKQRLEAEGLFAPERKRPLPQRPKTIGVVTSGKAAAFQDILNVLRRRYPLATVVLSPTLVQGENAPLQIVAALHSLNAMPEVEVIILARGGGAPEELAVFNDERVARAVFTSRHPVITGVGHETDFTIVDFVADMRAPTPSAAAELVSPDIADIRSELEELQSQLSASLDYRLEESRAAINALQRRLELASPSTLLAQQRNRVEQLIAQISQNTNHRLKVLQLETRALSYRLKVLDPQQILQRGYAIVTKKESGEVIHDISQIANTNKIRVRLSNGEFEAEVR
ncbi:MAG: exodeoxyribonuclease VII large subunit [Chloroflexi bacterium]|uniref:Exodeoxyribonuclease 7 large subunit n=1 Tax=Candidatus Chlorohelix allophototropha TaxID=3003348 RepID=A0A8T7M1U8_9CHLR|nr:exodeoxyribonuclease VII large subunit [Chloroflexota bacterium]WJW66679.1 exodeoxyribonuclease VII large subunit [Chloroflexota bacterium L227-S17]